MKLVSSEGRALVDAVRYGVGVAQVFYDQVEGHLKQGRLVHLL